MATIPLTISGIREAQQQLADLGKEFDKLKDDPIESDRLAKEFNKLAKEVHGAEEAFDEMNKSGKNLSATFEQIYGDDLQPMTSRIGELEDRMYELALAGQQNSEEFQTMAAEAAKLRQTIIETDKQVDLLAENRGLSVVATGFRQVGESLLRLDFEGAARDAKVLNASLTGLGSRGAKALKGLGSTVVQLGKTFVKMGAALLANPIFLMAAVVTALVAAIIALMNELGLLQPILDALSAAFEFVKEAIMGVVQALKDFSDWLGITNYEAQELASTFQGAADEIIAKADELQKKITQNYDQEIALAQIAGEDTTRLEIEKQDAIRKTADARRKALEVKIRQNEVSKKLDEEEIKTLKDKLAAENDLVRQANNEIQKIRLRDQVQQQKDREAQIAKDKAAYQKRLQAQRDFEKMRLQISRQIQDLELDLQEDGINKDLEANQVKYARLIEDVKANEKLTAEERTRLIELYNEQEFEKRKEIELKYQKDLQEAVDAANKERKEKEEAERLEELERQKNFNEALLAADKELRDKQLAEQKARLDARVHLQEAFIGSIQSLEQGLAAAGVRTAGLQKVLALVEIATSTAKAIANIVAGATAAAAAGGPAAPFLVGGYIASGIATVAGAIASAKAALSSAPSIGGSTASSTSVPSATPAQPSFELFGQNNDANNLGDTENEENTQNINVTAMVSEVELTAKQKKQQKLQESAIL